MILWSADLCKAGAKGMALGFMKNPHMATWPWGSSVCLCWWSRTTNAQSLSFTNRGSYCTSAVQILCTVTVLTLSAPTQRACKCSTNNLPRTLKLLLSSQLRRGIYAFPYEKQLCALLPAEQLKNPLYIHKISPHWELLSHLWKQSRDRMCKRLYLQVAQLCSEKPGGKFSL